MNEYQSRSFYENSCYGEDYRNEEQMKNIKPFCPTESTVGKQYYLGNLEQDYQIKNRYEL